MWRKTEGCSKRFAGDIKKLHLHLSRLWALQERLQSVKASPPLFNCLVARRMEWLCAGTTRRRWSVGLSAHSNGLYVHRIIMFAVWWVGCGMCKGWGGLWGRGFTLLSVYHNSLSQNGASCKIISAERGQSGRMTFLFSSCRHNADVPWVYLLDSVGWDDVVVGGWEGGSNLAAIRSRAANVHLHAGVCFSLCIAKGAKRPFSLSKCQISYQHRCACCCCCCYVYAYTTACMHMRSHLFRTPRRQGDSVNILSHRNGRTWHLDKMNHFVCLFFFLFFP